MLPLSVYATGIPLLAASSFCVLFYAPFPLSVPTFISARHALPLDLHNWQLASCRQFLPPFLLARHALPLDLRHQYLHIHLHDCGRRLGLLVPVGGKLLHDGDIAAAGARWAYGRGIGFYGYT